MICPRLQPHVQTVAIHHSVFPDHVIIHVTMSPLASPQPVPRWFKPGVIKLSSAQVAKYRDQWSPSSEGTVDQGDTCLMTSVSQTGRHEPCTGLHNSIVTPSTRCQATQAYAQLWETWETDIDHFLRRDQGVGLMSHQRGRGHTTRRTFHIPRVHTIKPARDGEMTIDCSRPTLQLKRWVQQVRRLTNLTRTLRTQDGGLSVSAHQEALWTAILKVRGFHPSFSHWWPNRPVQGQSDWDLPSTIPTYQVALEMKDHERSDGTECETVGETVKPSTTPGIQGKVCTRY